MKQTKKLTRSQRNIVLKAGFDTREYDIRVIEETQKYLHIQINNEFKDEVKISKED